MCLWSFSTPETVLATIKHLIKNHCNVICMLGLLICFPVAFHMQMYVCSIICLVICALLGLQLTYMRVMSLHLHGVHAQSGVCPWQRYMFSSAHAAVLFQCLHLMHGVVCRPAFAFFALGG